jgi:methylase of polypeptide subunit release factors
MTRRFSNFKIAAFVFLITVGFVWLLSKAQRTSDSNSNSTLLPRLNPDASIPTGQVLNGWRTVEDFDLKFAQFETVFWDPRDTISLRDLIRHSDLVAGSTVMEIGCGTGLLGLCCIKAGAEKLVVTDVNPNAIANTRFNAARLGYQNQIETRLVSLDDLSAYSRLKQDEKFDLIISNPPWVNQKPDSIDEYALYDENFKLIESLLDDVKEHLQPGGRVWLAYGCVDAIQTIEKLAQERGLAYTILDDRELSELTEEFLPGMLIEIIP